MNRQQALGLAIRNARRKQKLSQEKLAELAKLHRNFIGLVERAETPPAVDSLFAIADALGILASALVATAEEISGSRFP
jgi:transcriptional regulator with XRE-family HTH domain